MRSIIAVIMLLAVAWGAASAGDNAGAGDPPSDDGGFGMGGLIGGPHDFSDLRGRPGDACSACHVPHVQAVRPATQPAATTQPVMEMYKIRGQRRVFQAGRFMPGASSLVCLGCHDGTIAPSTIGTSHALLAGLREGFGTADELKWGDHPIGIPYPNKPGEFRPSSFVLATGKVKLPEGRLECISCHDPHGESGEHSLLVMSNRRSALCLTCHIK